MKKKLSDYLELTKEWHPTKNGDLNPKDVNQGSQNKAWWKCPVAEDHEWEAVIASRVNGTGCPCCSGYKFVPSNSLEILYPEIAKQWHPTKNGSLKPSDVIAGTTKKFWWKCYVIDDHEWNASMNNRVNGSGCPCCSGRKAVLSNCLTTIYPEIAKQWHPTKNGNLTPEDVVSGTAKKNMVEMQ